MLFTFLWKNWHRDAVTANSALPFSSVSWQYQRATDRLTHVTSPLPFSPGYFCQFEAGGCWLHVPHRGDWCEVSMWVQRGLRTRHLKPLFSKRLLYESVFFLSRDYFSPLSTRLYLLCFLSGFGYVNLQHDKHSSTGLFITVCLFASGSKRCQSALRWCLSVASSVKNSHTLTISVVCEHMCLFFISMWRLLCRASQKEASSTQKPVSAFFLPWFFFFFSFHSSFLLPFFALSGLQGLRTQAPKDYQTHPFQEHWALQLYSNLIVCACVWLERERLRSHTFCSCQRKESVGGKTERRGRWRRVGVCGGRRSRLSNCCSPTQTERKRKKKNPELSFGLQPASATMQLLCGSDLEKTFQRREEKSGRCQKIHKLAMREHQKEKRRNKTGGKIITKEEMWKRGQTNNEKREKIWNEKQGLNHTIETHSWAWNAD